MMKMGISPLHVFRIYAEPKSKLYCDVSIWNSAEEMYAAVDDGNDYHGMCTEVIIINCQKGKPERKKPIFAEMHLVKTRITWRIITHELFHAILYWMKRRKITTKKIENRMKVEERCAYAYTQLLDNLVEQLHNHDLQVTL